MKIGNVECYGVIYKITNIINNKSYIGQTTVGFNRRYCYRGKGVERVYKFHKYCKNNGNDYNECLLGAIEKYGFNAFEVVEIFDIAFSQNELDIKEKHYIQQFNSFINRGNGNGYNKDRGGKPSIDNTIKNKTREEKEKIKEKIEMKRAEWYNNLSQEEIDKRNENKRIDALLQWQNLSDTERKNMGNKISEGKIGKCKGKDNPHAKPVICITTNMIFDTIKEASKYYKIKNPSNIVRCCQGELKSAGKLEDKTKLVWKYITIIEL